MWTEGLHTTGGSMVPQRNHLWHAITTPMPCNLWHNFHLGLSGPELLPSVCHSNSLLGIPLHTCYHLPHDPGYKRPANITVPPSGHFLHTYFHLHITMGYRWWVGIMGDKLLVYCTMKAAGEEEWGNKFIQPTLVIASTVQSDINIIIVAQELLLRTVLWPWR